MIEKTRLILFVLLFTFTNDLRAQVDTCISQIKKYEITSKYLDETRAYWVSLPMNYDTSKSYPVIYLFDAEWRFDLIRTIAYDMAGNKKIPHHIIVGIPHVNWKTKRGIDLTFSHSKNEYDGEQVDSTVYNTSNSGGGQLFFDYLNNEVISAIDKDYPTNGENVLIGHSYGGYFNTYILSRAHKNTTFQIYDPSIWYSNGESIAEIKNLLSKDRKLNVFISYQLEPSFHSNKIEELIEVLSVYQSVTLGTKKYEEETHNSLFMGSFIDGMNYLYGK